MKSKAMKFDVKQNICKRLKQAKPPNCLTVRWEGLRCKWNDRLIMFLPSYSLCILRNTEVKWRICFKARKLGPSTAASAPYCSAAQLRAQLRWRLNINRKTRRLKASRLPACLQLVQRTSTFLMLMFPQQKDQRLERPLSLQESCLLCCLDYICREQVPKFT